MSDKGLTVWEALEALYDQDLDCLTYVDCLHDINLQRPLIQELAAGRLYATHIAEGREKEEVIASKLWEAGRLYYFDIADNSAMGDGGLRFVGVRIYDGAPESKPTGQRPRVKEADLRKVVEQQCAAGEVQRDPGLKEARKAFPDKVIDPKLYRRLLGELNPNKKPVGRPRKAIK